MKITPTRFIQLQGFNLKRLLYCWKSWNDNNFGKLSFILIDQQWQVIKKECVPIVSTNANYAITSDMETVHTISSTRVTDHMSLTENVISNYNDKNIDSTS